MVSDAPQKFKELNHFIFDSVCCKSPFSSTCIELHRGDIPTTANACGDYLCMLGRGRATGPDEIKVEFWESACRAGI